MNKKRKYTKKQVLLEKPSFYASHHKQTIILASLLLLLLGLVAFFILQFKPVKETPKGEVKNLPKDIKKFQTNATFSATFRIPILMYHYVENVQDRKDKFRISLNIPPSIFESQITTLQNAGYTFMTAGEVGEVIDGKRKLPPQPVVITIDDGHWDVYTDILPILKKHNVKATAYIISGFIGGSDFLSKEQLQAVIDSGLIEIGGHTVHHIALANKLAPIVSYEVTDSKQALENAYHIHIVSFAYPDGSFDKQATDLVQKAGYTNAVSTVPGIAQSNINRFYLFRLRPGYRTEQELLQYLEQNSFRAY